MKSVYQAANILEAEIVRGMLAAEGIESHVTGFYLQGGVGELAPADNARVLVDEQDAPRAAELIRDYAADSGKIADEPTSTGGAFWLISLIVLVFIAVVSYLLG